MIHVTDESGNEVFVNPNHIIKLSSIKEINLTELFLTPTNPERGDSHRMFVKEPPAELIKRIKNFTQGF